MRSGLRWLLPLLLSIHSHGQQPLAPQTLLLSRIKYHNLLTLARLPNYTCRETIERSYRTPPDRKFHILDLVRLEVAYVGNRELYGWPGAQKFEEKDITETANSLGIGPMGFGGKTTLLGTKICAINRLPASFFVSISYMCWAFRRRGVELGADGTIGKWLY